MSFKDKLKTMMGIDGEDRCGKGTGRCDPGFWC